MELSLEKIGPYKKWDKLFCGCCNLVMQSNGNGYIACPNPMCGQAHLQYDNARGTFIGEGVVTSAPVQTGYKKFKVARQSVFHLPFEWNVEHLKELSEFLDAFEIVSMSKSSMQDDLMITGPFGSMFCNFGDWIVELPGLGFVALSAYAYEKLIDTI